MWPFKKKIQRVIWTERQIKLFERQIAAREALGEKYICHPANDVGRLSTAKFQGMGIASSGSSSDSDTGIYLMFDAPPKLRRVK